MVVFTEESSREFPGIVLEAEKVFAEASRLFGCRVYAIPTDFATSDGADNALAYLGEHVDEPGLVCGFIPTRERYAELYDAALKRGVRLLNTPEESTRCMEFDLFYPRIEDLTPKSIVVSGEEDLPRAEELGFPLFVKGAIKSQKEQGWSACVVTNPEALRERMEHFVGRSRSRHKMVVRRLVPLRHTGITPQGFPLGREFRTVWFRGELMGYGFYWGCDSPLSELSPEEESAMLSMAGQAVDAMEVPFLVVDIGQLEDMSWIVIETGDPQFSGLTTLSTFEFWGRLTQVFQSA